MPETPEMPAITNLWSEAQLSGGPPGPTEVTPAGVVAGAVIEIVMVLIALGLAICAAVLGSSSEEACCAVVGAGFTQAGRLW
jgi:hypothetical protein